MEDFDYLIGGLITAEDVASTLGVSIRTISRWRADPARVPVAVRLWLELLRGRIEAIHPAWSGWIINNQTGDLISPEGVTWTPGRLNAMPYVFGERDALRAEKGKLKEEIDRLNAEIDELNVERRQWPANVIPFPGNRSACERGPRPA